MTTLVPIMLIGWIPLSIVFFDMLKPHRAVLCSLIGGTLFLPLAGYDIPGLPDYSKSTALAASLFFGGLFTGKWKLAKFKWKRYDIPIIVFCLISFVSSLSNQLGPYDGFSKCLASIFFIGIPYMAGRIYFGSMDSLRDLSMALLIGGLIYVPFCLFEIRMSPQLSNIFYGFFPHSFLQHFRYDGYRPIVFMSHGLMVSLWMAVSTIIAFWYWRARKVVYIKGIPMWLVFLALAVTTILCKSANGWIVMALGCIFFYLHQSNRSKMFFICFLLAIALYPELRITGIISADKVKDAASLVFDDERVDSLSMRLWQEDLFIEKTIERPLLGWAGSKNGWPTKEDGTLAVPMIDAIWLIFFNSKGYLGLISYFFLMLQGPWLNFRFSNRYPSPFDDHAFIPRILSLVVIFFMMDSLVNGMINPVYFMVSGALVSFHLNQQLNMFQS
jgi:hypothetical protein